jgi:hypothetical protein
MDRPVQCPVAESPCQALSSGLRAEVTEGPRRLRVQKTVTLGLLLLPGRPFALNTPVCGGQREESLVMFYTRETQREKKIRRPPKIKIDITGVVWRQGSGE